MNAPQGAALRARPAHSAETTQTDLDATRSIHRSEYRADIDGLRAIAVLSVLIFHAFPRALPGGFVGVDIFFVISGYLITNILIREAKERVSNAPTFTAFISRFYARRIRRILPALVIVLACTSAVGWAFLLPSDFRDLGRNVLSSSLFASNLNLMWGPGYFDAPAEANPLLHLWSLGVEEQFYILWPCVIFFCRGERRFVIIALSILFAFSFCTNVALSSNRASLAYYSPLTRIWEPLLGGAIAASGARSGSRAISSALSFIGAALVLAALVLIRPDSTFPGWWALVPGLGSAAFITAGQTAPLNRLLLSARPVVWIGLISYPVYLWHWPLIVFPRDLLGELTTESAVIAIIGSFVLAYATYKFVEGPLRHGKDRSVIFGLLLSLAILGLFGVFATTHVIRSRAEQMSDLLVGATESARSDWIDKERADFIIPGAMTTVFLGDSYMEQYYPRLEELRHKARRSIVLRASGGCAPFTTIERKGRHCSAFMREAFLRASEPDVDRVVIAGSWEGFIKRGDYYSLRDKRRLNVLTEQWIFDDFAEQIRFLRSRGKQVAVVLGHPSDDLSGPLSRLHLSAGHWVANQPHVIDRLAYERRVAQVQTKIEAAAIGAGAVVIDPSDFLCSARSCSTASSDGRPMYKDATHLRASFVREHIYYLDDWALDAR